MGETKDWFVYMLRCNNDAYYCGVSSDLKKRVETHNKGKGSKYTARFRPVKLIWSRKVGSNSVAQTFECKIKKWGRSKKEKLVKGLIYLD